MSEQKGLSAMKGPFQHTHAVLFVLWLTLRCAYRLQHAPAAVAGEHVNHEELPLGPVPHMVRGQLSGFSQMCLTGQAFRQCTACSQTVVDQYKQHGWPFLWQALQVRWACQ